MLRENMVKKAIGFGSFEKKCCFFFEIFWFAVLNKKKAWIV
jgi:hypothetical protein